MSFQRLIGIILLVVATAMPVWAQPTGPDHREGFITSTTCPGTGCVLFEVAGRASVGLQVTGTWVATLTLEGTVDGTTFQALTFTAINGTSGVTTTTGNGVWAASVAGMIRVRVRASAYTSGTANVALQAAASGGGVGGGGGGGSDVTIHDPNTVSQKVAVNASGQMSITCANCSGSGASAVDTSAFTVGATSGAPSMGLFETTITPVTNATTGAFAMDANRSLFGVIRDAAGNARGANVSAANALKVDGSAVTQPVSGTVTVNGTVTITDGAGAVNTIVDSSALPSGASTAAKQPALGTAGTASTDVITVQGIASMTPLLVSDGSGALNVIVDSSALPTSAATSTKQSDGTQKTQIVDGSGNVIASTSNNLNVQCANCSGSGVSAADEATFTAGTSLFAGAGGFFQTTATSNALTNGQQGMFQVTAQRALFANLRNASGTEIGTSTTPVQVSLANTGSNATAVHTICDTGCGGSGGTSAADGATYTAGTTSGTPMIGARDDASVGTVAEDKLGIARITTNRALHVNMRDASGNEITWPVDATTNTTTQTTGPQVFFNGSTAAPSDVGADGRSVAAWSTLKGAQVTAPSFAGVVAVAGNGASGTGVQRVTIANDSTGIIALTTSTAQIGHLEANQSSNIAQINGVTPLMGNGASGTGAQRVTIANDSTGTVAVTQATASNLNARTDTSGATGAAPPARADFVGGLSSGATGGFVIGIPVCDSFKAVSMTSATTTLMVTGVSGRHVRICSVNLVTAIANNVVMISGTGATCGTGTAGIAGGTTAANGWNFAANGGITVGSGIGTVMQTAATGDSVCIITSAAGPLAGTIAYTIY